MVVEILLLHYMFFLMLIGLVSRIVIVALLVIFLLRYQSNSMVLKTTKDSCPIIHWGWVLGRWSSLLSELGYTFTSTPTIFCDTFSTIYYFANPVCHSRMKHIATEFHYVCDKVQKGTLKVSHISGDNQLADVLTMPLSHARFSFLICDWPYHWTVYLAGAY